MVTISRATITQSKVQHLEGMRFLELLSRVQFSISIRIDHFTVVGLAAWPLHDSEVGIELVLIEASLLFNLNRTN